MIQGYEFAIYLTHHGRPVPEPLRHVTDGKYGIIALSLDRTREIFSRSKRGGGEHYRTTLQRFLSQDLQSKQWIFHPRYKALEKKALSASYSIGNESTQERGRDLRSASTPVVFECIMCKCTWKGVEESASACPKCETHLYRRVKERGTNAT